MKRHELESAREAMIKTLTDLANKWRVTQTESDEEKKRLGENIKTLEDMIESLKLGASK